MIPSRANPLLGPWVPEQNQGPQKHMLQRALQSEPDKHELLRRLQESQGDETVDRADEDEVEIVRDRSRSPRS